MRQQPSAWTRRAWLAAGAATMAGRMTGQATESLDALSERFIKLALAVGQHHPDYIDAYYGPPEWKEEASRRKITLPAIQAEARSLEAKLLKAPAPADEMTALRRRYLVIQTRSAANFAAMLGGRKFTFDEESRALYDAVAPQFPDTSFQKTIDDLRKWLPGSSSLSERYSEWQKAFTIPLDRLDRVIGEATSEARRRTKAHIALPENENFVREFVTGKVWTGYNWYKGGAQSLIQINTDLPMEPATAIRMACHEGYPGHHVYNALLEDRLVRKRGWQEYSVYPLFSPQSLIAEGTADYGVELTFPAAERIGYFESTLFPLAGLDRTRAKEYVAVQESMSGFEYARLEAARRFLDGRITKSECEQWLQQYAAQSPKRAAQQVAFFEKNRSYILNYRHGRDLVAAYLKRRVPSGDPAALWREFEALMSSPRLPSGLV